MDSTSFNTGRAATRQHGPEHTTDKRRRESNYLTGDTHPHRRGNNVRRQHRSLDIQQRHTNERAKHFSHQMPTPVRYPWTTWRTSDEQYYTEMTTTMKTSQKNTRASTSISSAEYSKAWRGLARHGSSQSPEQQHPHNHDHRFQTCRNQHQQ